MAGEFHAEHRVTAAFVDFMRRSLMHATSGGKILLLTPFREPTRTFYLAIMKAVSDPLGATVDQLDADTTPHELVKTLFEAVSHADVVVAALDHGRPNVAFEVGFAQALGHRPICLARSARAWPRSCPTHPPSSITVTRRS